MTAQIHLRKAFSLVELLVVIGIVAMLIAILLPIVGSARTSAQRVVCAANIHQQLVLAEVHAASHGGFYPLVGIVPGALPENLDDQSTSKYDYFSYSWGGYNRPLAPITIALSAAQSRNNILTLIDPNAIGKMESDDHGFMRTFLCPTQVSSISELGQLAMAPMLYYFDPMGAGESGNIIWYRERGSYIYNEAELGWGYNDGVDYGRGRGKASRVRQPSKTMFSADGLRGTIDNARVKTQTGYAMGTLYNNPTNPKTGSIVSPPVTMADALAGNGKAGDPQNFDKLRHNGRINIGFFDGHVETREISAADLNSVFLLAP